MPKTANRRPKAPYRGSVIPTQELLETLESLYGRSRFVPRFDPLEELVSCILSQHTADANSFPTFTRLRAAYPDWAEVEALGPEKLAGVIRQAGLTNQKAKSICGCLRTIRERFGGYTLEPLESMSDLAARDWLLSLPGVGLKTASIVLCFSFGRHLIPVDTHVHRVSTRLGLLRPGRTADQAHDDLLAIVPQGVSFRFHIALIQHGRILCQAKAPLCGKCPLQDRCPWFAEVTLA
ncbi:MAG: endonuclease III [Fimbriimonadaceae bacterium]|nr:endonuclease III [Fimbriimonadaceae bacterium]QYK57019.1 MAG: endonuclease III [Fimbriimonadaceae bacterium]